jgi:hypothetical protein
MEETFRQISSSHRDQIARLNFPGLQGSRPALIKGIMPENPKGSTNDYARIALSVNPDGKPDGVKVLQTSNDKWGEDVVREINGWRFQAPAQRVDGVLELTIGNARIPPAGISGR